MCKVVGTIRIYVVACRGVTGVLKHPAKHVSHSSYSTAAITVSQSYL